MRVKLGEICTIKSSKRVFEKEYVDVGVPFIRGQEISDGSINEIHTKFQCYISKERFEQLKNTNGVPKINDILITAVGTIGNLFFVDRKFDFYFKDGNVIWLTDFNEKVNPKYLYFFMKSQYFFKQLEGAMIGAVQKALTMVMLSKIEFELPNYNEQTRIANFLERIENKINNNNKIINELEQMTKTIYDYWFLQFEFPNEEGKPYKSSGGKMVWNEELKRKIPEIFNVEKIENIITIKDGTHDSPQYVDSGKYLITSKHLDKTGIKFNEANFITEKDFEKINTRSKVDKGDILFSMIGALGNVYMVDEDIINFAIKNVALYKTSEKIELGSYIFTTLKSILMEKYIQTTMLGSIQKFIPLGTLRKMPLLYNENVISKFNEKTKSIFMLQSELKKENIELMKLRNYLLPLLMNGQVGFKRINK